MIGRTVLAAATFLASAQAHAQLLTDEGELFGFFGGVQTAVPVTGLGVGEKLLAIDRRRANGSLYGITATRLYSIDSRTAVATAISPAGAFNLSGSSFDMEAEDNFIRVISNTGQNFRVAPGTGTVQGFDAPFAYRLGDENAGRAANIVAMAYRTYYGAFYGVDADLDIWVQIDQATSSLTTMGKMGVDVSPDAGLDFSGSTGHATLVTNPSGSDHSVFYELNPSTRVVRRYGRFPVGYRFVDVAETTVPEPVTWAMMLMGLGAVGAALRRARSSSAQKFIRP